MISSIYLNIGSNSGDRSAYTAQAVAAVHSMFPDSEITVSSPFLSKAWGYESENEFLNTGVCIRTERQTEWSGEELENLLDAILETQNNISATPHRNDDGTYRDRELDIDIIAVDEIRYHSRRLCLPHPRMHLRDFVLRPMAEISPEWKHPETGLTCAEMLQ